MLPDMRYRQNFGYSWPLRIGLGLVYLYSGYDLIAHPLNWIGYMPDWFGGMVSAIMPLDQYLKIQGAGEIVLALVFLAWFLPRWIVCIAAAAAAAEMAGILLFVGIDPVTFRDIGLLGAAVALMIHTGYNKHL